MIKSGMSRRQFTSSAAAALVAPSILSAATPREVAPSDQLSFACVGMGGQMRNYLVPELQKIDQRIVAICDVDQRQTDLAKQIPGLEQAREYRDYRELLAQESGVDGVLIGTPDHWHVPICKAALESGKHVYCEKPLAHSVAECRELERLAIAHPELVTQTGNQGCATEGFRRSFEVIRAGLLGEVTDVHVWLAGKAQPRLLDRPPTGDPVPEGLNWDFWLGTAPERPYNDEIYHPARWRAWYDFGGGSLADFCCHSFQLAYRALDLDAPVRISATGENLGHEAYPTRCNVEFEFAAKGDRGPVRIHFYSGENNKPPLDVTKAPVGDLGCLLVGEEGTLSAGLWNTDCAVWLRGDERFHGADDPRVAEVAFTQPRIQTEVLKWDPRRTAKGQRPRWSRVNNSHMFEWALACTGEAKAYSPFEIGARITEIGMLGVLALRMQRPIDWDAAGRRAVGLPEADSIIDPTPREPWASVS